MLTLYNAGTDGQVDVVVAGGTPNYTYAWSNGDADDVAENLSAGT
ncbi:MAG: SprB repeat-containing protein [Flavobacteriales bacterium]|nr:SprB repeat-containing protein [Flavobacteriales bacterium]